MITSSSDPLESLESPMFEVWPMPNMLLLDRGFAILDAGGDLARPIC